MGYFEYLNTNKEVKKAGLTEKELLMIDDWKKAGLTDEECFFRLVNRTATDIRLVTK